MCCDQVIIPWRCVEHRDDDEQPEDEPWVSASRREWETLIPSPVAPDQQAEQDDWQDQKAKQECEIGHGPILTSCGSIDGRETVSWISFSTMIADERTPGNPAPGCVPAPTKYRLSKSSARL